MICRGYRHAQLTRFGWRSATGAANDKREQTVRETSSIACLHQASTVGPRDDWVKQAQLGAQQAAAQLIETPVVRAPAPTRATRRRGPVIRTEHLAFFALLYAQGFLRAPQTPTLQHKGLK